MVKKSQNRVNVVCERPLKENYQEAAHLWLIIVEKLCNRDSICSGSDVNFSSNRGLSVFSVKKRASLLTLRGVLLLLRVDDEVDAPCLLGGG